MKHTYEHGDTYEGDFVNGKRHGSGVYVSVSGARYEGEWQNDMRHGYGILSFTAPESLDEGGGSGMAAWAGTYEGQSLAAKETSAHWGLVLAAAALTSPHCHCCLSWCLCR